MSDGKVYKARSDRIWIAIGKISLILGIVVALVRLTNTFTSPKPRITGFVSCSEFQSPPDRARVVDAVDGLMLDDIFLPKEHPDRNNKTLTKLRLLSYANYNMYCKVRVVNFGNREAKDIVLDFPASGLAVVMDQDSEIHESQFKASILLKNLRPGKELSAQLWSFSNLNKIKEIRLYHTGGRGKVKYLTPVWGIGAIMRRHWFMSIIITTTAILFCLVSLVLTVWMNNKRRA